MTVPKSDGLKPEGKDKGENMHKSRVQTAIVLVGGFGTRLRPLTLDIPKQMLPIANRPMIELVLGQLASAGITDAVLALGYKPDTFLGAYPEGKCAGVKLTYAVEPEPLDTAGAIKFAYEQAGLSDETILAVNGDVICDADLGALTALHFSKATSENTTPEKSSQMEASVTLLSVRVEDPSQFGVMVISPDSEVLEFHEKPDPKEGYGNNINAGVYVLNSKVLELIQSNTPVSIEKEIFPELVKDGKLFAHVSDSYWIDAGTPETYLRAQLDFVKRNGVADTPPIAQVADSAKVESSVVGRNVVVSDGAEVFESVLLDGTKVEPNAVVKRSILGYGSSIGEGAKLTNLCVVGHGDRVPPFSELDGFRMTSEASASQTDT